MKSIILASMFFIGLNGFAQVRDRVSVQYDQLPAVSGLRSNQVEANLSERFFLDQDGESLLTVGLQYRHVNLETDLAGVSPEQRELQMVVPQLSLMQLLGEEYSLIVNVRPGFFGDLKSDWGQTFRLEGGAVLSRVWTDQLTLGLGLGRGSNFGRDLTIPVLQVLYFATSQIMIDALLPVKAEVWYLPSREWEFGALFNIVGSLYRITDSQQFDANQLGYANMQAGVGVRRIFANNLYVMAELGHTVSRRYLWSQRRDPRFGRGLDDTAYGRLSFGCRF